MPVFDDLQSVAGVPYHRAEYNKDIIDMVILRRAREEGIRLPTGTKPDVFNYHGAWVAQPRAGINRNVMYLDLASLYPNALRGVNIGPDTIIGTQKDLERSEYTEDDCYWSYIDDRPVKHVGEDEDWQDFIDGEYKMVYDPNSSGSSMKWRDDPQYDRCYYLKPSIKEGFLREVVQDLIDMKSVYSGSKYEAVKRVTNCFTPDTDVLTPEGVKNIQDMEIGDNVYSFNKDTEEVDVKEVTRTFSYPEYDGELVDLWNQNIDFSVTPNHNMVVQNANPSNSDDSYKFIEAGELSDGSAYRLPNDWGEIVGERLDVFDLSDWFDDGEYEVWVNNSIHGRTFQSNINWEGVRRKIGIVEEARNGYRIDGEVFDEYREYIEDNVDEKFIHTRQKNSWVPLEYNGDDVLELVSWFITEGNLFTSTEKEYENTKRGITRTFHLAQKQEGGRDAIRSLLDRMGLRYHESENGFTVSSKIWCEFLEEHCGKDSFSKKIPEFVFDCSSNQKKKFLKVLMDGDGDTNNNSHRYTTSSKELRDDVMRLMVHLGRTPKYSFDSGSWRIFTGETNNYISTKNSRNYSTSDEGVYCVEVEDNHTLLAGRNGKFQFVGNSVYGYCSYLTEHTSSRLADWRIGESITLAGRKIIQYSAETALDMLSERVDGEVYVAVGDTDGIGLCWPQAPIRDVMADHVEDIVDHLNGDGYDTFMKKAFGVDETHHYQEIENESYAPSLFVPQDFSANEERLNEHLQYSRGGGNDVKVGTRKRYAQWITIDEGEEVDDVKIKGMEAVRSDTATVTQEAQKQILEWLLKKDFGAAWKEIAPYLRDLHDQISAGEYPLGEIAKRGGIRKPPEEYGSASRSPQPIYRGAKYADEHFDGVTIRAGSKPLTYYVKSVGDYPSTYTAETGENGQVVDAVAVEEPSDLPDDVVIDYEKHVTKVLEEPLNPILKTIGKDWDEVKYGHEQVGFNEFAATTT